MKRAAVLLVAAAMTVVGVNSAPAGEPESGSSPPTLGSSSNSFGVRSAGSLAEVARRLRLARPEGEQGLEVNDLNLREIAGEGAISVTEGAVVVPRPETPSGTQPAETAAADWAKRYEEQTKSVKKAEERLTKIDEYRSQVRDPYRSSLGPYSSAPGAVSEGQQQRDEAARDLADQRAKLDALQREGRRLGAGG